MPRSQTIQTDLSTDNPRGMRVAEITTRIVRVIEVPRASVMWRPYKAPRKSAFASNW